MADRKQHPPADGERDETQAQRRRADANRPPRENKPEPDDSIEGEGSPGLTIGGGGGHA